VLRAGDTIGDHQLVRRLGAGGFGVVWLGEPTNGGPPVAVKVLHADLVGQAPSPDGPSIVERFISEAQILERLDHPGVVGIVDIIDRRRTGIVAYVMERLQGHELGKLAPHLDLLGVLAVFCQVADTLAYVHERGVIHRDIKPNNIFVCVPEEADTEPLVKLIDFGIAKDRGASQQLPSTRANVLGTLSTTAPESFDRAEDEGVAITAAVDQWGFGIALYTVLAGHPPFRLNTPLALIEQIRRQPPPPLALADHYGHTPLPVELEELVQRCLQKAPEDRYPSSTALSDALATLINRLKDRPSLDVSGILSTTLQTRALPIGAQTFVVAVLDETPAFGTEDASHTENHAIGGDTKPDVLGKDAAPTVGIEAVVRPKGEASAPTHVPGVEEHTGPTPVDEAPPALMPSDAPPPTIEQPMVGDATLDAAQDGPTPVDDPLAGALAAEPLATVDASDMPSAIEPETIYGDGTRRKPPSIPDADTVVDPHAMDHSHPTMIPGHDDLPPVRPSSDLAPAAPTEQAAAPVPAPRPPLALPQPEPPPAVQRWSNATVGLVLVGVVAVAFALGWLVHATMAS